MRGGAGTNGVANHGKLVSAGGSAHSELDPTVTFASNVARSLELDASGSNIVVEAPDCGGWLVVRDGEMITCGDHFAVRCQCEIFDAVMVQARLSIEIGIDRAVRVQSSETGIGNSVESLQIAATNDHLAIRLY